MARNGIGIPRHLPISFFRSKTSSQKCATKSVVYSLVYVAILTIFWASGNVRGVAIDDSPFSGGYMDSDTELPSHLPCSKCGEVFKSSEILINRSGPSILLCRGCAGAEYPSKPTEGICFTCKEPFWTDDLNFCAGCGAQFCSYDPIVACDCIVTEYIDQLEQGL
jgi:hypothetical protein